MTARVQNTPKKYCECGCGLEIVARYTASNKRCGIVKGELRRYYTGHQFNNVRSQRWQSYVEKKTLELHGKKICSWCRIPKTIDQFYPSKVGLYKVGGRCKECSDKTSSQWQKDRPEWKKTKNRKSYRRAKAEVFERYGSACKCCGETEPMFLTIDHVNNDGGGRYRKDRGYAMYQKIIDEGFPAKYQVLCWNCNTGKQRNGGVCPHKAHGERYSDLMS